MNTNQLENPADRLYQHLSAKTGGQDSSEKYLLTVLERFVKGTRLQAEYRPVDIESFESLARLIDHTALKPETDTQQIRVLCEEAKKYGFASVCINSAFVPIVHELLQDSAVAVCTVVGFPLGATLSDSKAAETVLAVRAGASEIDMVINIGFLKDRKYERVEEDIRAVVESAHGAAAEDSRIIIKVIIETALLTEEEKVIACVLAHEAGADFVKTSTGFSKAGATPADVSLMRATVGSRMGVKAAGGIRSYEDAMSMVMSGADRLGASASVAIVEGIPNSAVGESIK